MKKLLQFVDNQLLSIWVAFLIFLIPVYPKIPLVDLPHTWVYIRLEDYFIAGLVLFFGIQLLRRKVKLFLPLELPIIIYWIAGSISLLLSLLIVLPTVQSLTGFQPPPNFFPNVAILSYLRRIEYMILFFIAFSSIKSQRDLKIYFWVLIGACSIILFYGIGQKYYQNLWATFPSYFANQKNPFCFQSFQTTNEEFAKGKGLCLPENGRITSLFGGHYDLAAYLVMVIPIIFACVFAIKKRITKLLITLLGIGLIALLVFTASRISFAAYLIGVTFTFIYMKQKKFIIPMMMISILLLGIFSSSTLQRILQTFRFANILVNSQGQVVGTVPEIPDELKKKITNKSLLVENAPPTEEIPPGSLITTLPGKETATTSGIISRIPNLSTEEKNRYQFGAVEISSVSGSFLIKKAVIFDSSFTTRFQGEWPHAWEAFMNNILFGSGYSSITNNTSDNSFIRALGETGILGLLSFLSIFFIFFIFVKQSVAEYPFSRMFMYGMAGGIIGLCINAVLIDVFEASKVAESLWLLLGSSIGAVALGNHKKIAYTLESWKVLTSRKFMYIYLFVLMLIFVGLSFDNFFVADDFTWLKWSATTQLNMTSLIDFFTNTHGFFYRPIDKIVFNILYIFLSFQSIGYYIFAFFLHSTIAIVAFLLLLRIFKNKYIAFFATLLFAFTPSHAQNLYWLSTISVNLSTLWILLGLLFYSKFREKDNWIFFVFALILFSLSVFSYEGGVIFILLVGLTDIFLNPPFNKKLLLIYILFALIDVLYLLMRSYAHAAGFSGDYSYNIVKLVPNFIGNFIGYIILFFFGNSAMPFISALRNNLKHLGILFNIVGAVCAVALLYIAQKKNSLKKMKDFKLELFGILFGFFSLLPFLGLGNTTDRYLYIGSFGFAIALTSLLRRVVNRYSSQKSNILLSVIIVAFLILFYIQNRGVEQQWHIASRISFDTLAKLRVDHSDLVNKSTIFFVNPPLQYKSAFVYPADSLADGVWFIYRDKKINIVKVNSIEEARELRKTIINTSGVNNTLILGYNDNLEMVKIDE